MKFWKLQGIGNDFIAIDGRDDNINSDDYGKLAKSVCHRKFSVGADGLLVVKNSNVADIEMVYYNSDGSRASMCGNGLRCFVKFVYDNNIVNKEKIDVDTLDGIKKIKINLKNKDIDTITVNMGQGSFKCSDIPINSNEEIENKLEEKELKAKAHLEDMFDITRNLSYADIKLLKKEQKGKSQKKIEENQNENQRDY